MDSTVPSSSSRGPPLVILRATTDVHSSSVEKEFEDNPVHSDGESVGHSENTANDFRYEMIYRSQSVDPPRRRTRRALPTNPTDTWMNREMLWDLSNNFPWLKQRNCRISESGETAGCPPLGFITVFMKQEEYGFRYPMFPEMTRVINHFEISPSQLHPNGWIDLALDVFLARCLGRELTPRVLCALHTFSRKTGEHYYTVIKKNNYGPFTDKADKLHDWDRYFFYVGLIKEHLLNPQFTSRWNQPSDMY